MSLPKPIPATNPTAVFTTDRESFHFDVSASLYCLADPKADPRADWKASADQWHITVTQREYGNTVGFDFWTGIGLRAFPPKPTGVTLHTHSIPKAPEASSFLSSIGSEVLDASTMPYDDLKALEWLDEEGLAEDAKPADALRMVRAFRVNRKKVATLLANTRLTVEEWAEWASELEA